MALVAVNGVELSVAESGAGEPLVLVHGGLADRTGWVFVEEVLAQHYHVVSYDRRGQSTSPSATGTRRDDEDDLAALIEYFGLAPANVVGISFGASITLALAARRPDVIRSAFVHEPPLTGVCPDDPVVKKATEQMDNRVVPLIECGEAEAAVETFVNDIVLGPGAWDLFPSEVQTLMVSNSETLLEEVRDPDWSTIDLAALAACPAPILLTHGDQSPPVFGKIVDVLRTSVPQMRVVSMKGAGHVPHLTNPAEWLGILREFID